MGPRAIPVWQVLREPVFAERVQCDVVTVPSICRLYGLHWSQLFFACRRWSRALAVPHKNSSGPRSAGVFLVVVSRMATLHFYGCQGCRIGHCVGLW